MQASQWSMALHLQNIKGANDPSYTRRSMETGVDASGRLAQVVRIRDLFVDDQYRAAAASVGDAETRRDIMNRIEDIFGDPTESGLGLAIDQFFDAFKAVSEDPADEVLRIEAIEAGRQFCQQVHDAMGKLSTIRGQINESIESNVTQINTLLENVRNLNARIAVLKNSNESDADLQDQRDAVLDDLAKLTGAVPTYLEDGTVRVMIGSMPAVDGLSLQLLETYDGPDGPLVRWKGVVAPQYSAPNGVLPAMLSMRSQGISDVMNEVDTLAKNVANEVNRLHRQGYDQNGQTGKDFFLIQPGVPGGIYVQPGLTADGVAAAGSNPVLQADGTIADRIYQLSTGMWPLYDGTYTSTQPNADPTLPDSTATLTLDKNHQVQYEYTYFTLEPVLDADNNPVLDPDGNPLTQQVEHTVKERGTWVQNTDGSVTIIRNQVYDEAQGKYVDQVPPVTEQYRRDSGELMRLDGGITYQASLPDEVDKTSSAVKWYRNLVGLIGSRGKAAIQDEEIAKAHVKVSEEQRSSKWGVSIDEEMAMLTAETKAFAAVARVMGVLDEMLETLINTAR